MLTCYKFHEFDCINMVFHIQFHIQFNLVLKISHQNTDSEIGYSNHLFNKSTNQGHSFCTKTPAVINLKLGKQRQLFFQIERPIIVILKNRLRHKNICKYFFLRQISIIISERSTGKKI